MVTHLLSFLRSQSERRFCYPVQVRRLLTAEEYILDRVQLTDSGCWEWQGHRNGDGYAVSLFRGKWRRAHRFTYETFVGPIGEGLTIDHLCRNRWCVNPSHLEPVTQKENVLRSPYTWGGRHKRKTHCINGHPFDEENTKYDSRGYRSCRACRRNESRQKSYRERRAAGRVERDRYCKNGHERTPENTYESSWRGRTVRRCLICKRETQKRTRTK